MPTLDDYLNEETRRKAFPVVTREAYFGHAGVGPICGAGVDAMNEFNAQASRGSQENPWVWEQVAAARNGAAALLGCSSGEISLLGPTSLGLSMVALGIDWKPGDEVVFHADDYPANVYPWRDLERKGVKPVAIRPETPGALTWELVEAALTERTRLVSLASCHYLTGYRIDIDGIGRRLRERGILFCLDAIQTIGAFRTSTEHVDFLSADSHKWMLGPAGAGIFFVRESVREQFRPPLLGSWNVTSPEFVAQETLAFESGGRRYEPGILNFPGICGMAAALTLLTEVGIDAIEGRLRHLRAVIAGGLAERGFVEASPGMPAEAQCAIVTVSHPTRDVPALGKAMHASGIYISLRRDREDNAFIRFSPHFYNTEEEINHAFAVMDHAEA